MDFGSAKRRNKTEEGCRDFFSFQIVKIDIGFLPNAFMQQGFRNFNFTGIFLISIGENLIYRKNVLRCSFFESAVSNWA